MMIQTRNFPKFTWPKNTVFFNPCSESQEIIISDMVRYILQCPILFWA